MAIQQLTQGLMMQTIVKSCHTKAPAAFALLIIVAMTSGCGTITRGTTQDIAIDSSPQGAVVQASNGIGGTTPLSIKAARNVPLTVKISKDGYKDHAAILTPNVSSGGTAGLAGNIFVGGIIGMAVDAGSGAMYDLTPDRVFAVLEKDEYVIERVSRKPEHVIQYRTAKPERIIEYRTEYVAVAANDPRLKNATAFHSNQNIDNASPMNGTSHIAAPRPKPEPKNIPASFGY
jgi:hypothetical protein